MKNMVRVIVILYALCMVQEILKAEALFLKDGSIIEGKITNDTDREVSIKVAGKDKRFPRTDVLRVIYDDSYKKKVYIFMNDKTVIEGFIVEETRDAYIYRTDIALKAEKTIKKDDVKFISKENLSLYDIQKKTEKPKLIADRKNKFLNLLGLRLGAMYSLTDNSVPDVSQADEFSMNIGLYYIDRFFEFNWDMNIGVGDMGGNLHQYVMTFLPLSMFNVELGISIGYINYDFQKLEGQEDNPGVRMRYNGLLIGLYYRWGGWFRIGFDYSMPVGLDVAYKYDTVTGTDEANYHSADLGFNCHTFIEVFVWTNMSFRLTYRYLGSKVSWEDDGTVPAPPGSIQVYNHCISLSIGYGLNLF